MPDKNLYERVADKLQAWDEHMMEVLPDAMRGGKAPPWSVHLNDAQIYDAYSRMTPSEAWARWESMTPEEQKKLAGIMNGPRPGGQTP